jgi:hypothetical protein
LINHGSTAIVAHDAGAANHIIAWLQSGLLDEKTTKLCLEGPALKIYQNIKPEFNNYSLEDALQNSIRLISGTGWSSNLEHQARVHANKLSIKSIAVIDHWVNYSLRFIRGGQQQLPDEIWVVDEYAHAIAKNTFPSISIVQQQNDYLNNQVFEIHQYQDIKNQEETCILFLMEPIRRSWGENPLPGEIQAFNYMLENLDSLLANNHNNRYKIIIKPHPSDPEKKYQPWVDKYSELSISVNQNDSLAKLIAQADIVAGCETYAMAVALSSGKKVISTLPPYAPECCLPHKEIVHLAEMFQK